ncbi:nickel-type superoxide dismutase maturation protease [Streptomyces pactum]|uniref:Nickel-type superoxide dismutase maturation protease n=1 Tax=Streptomyces pactum TaxID=68249 RepID=A0ABS0NPC7_9ACTN|nr:nickel-type superoxide dismutase maturation protease [Streptomyces pactum]MBH5336947.1 nickel-type superoxide dismutase maturation protease [Streptomyces pactum]
MQDQVRDRGPEQDRDSQGLLRIGLATVYGPSMTPTLLPGDRLVIRYGATLRPGNVVMLRHPFQQDLWIVKRLAERRDGGWWVLGDNPFATPDSREFGVVPDELVVGRAVLRLRPVPRATDRAQRSAGALLGWAASAVRPLGRRPAGGAAASSSPGRSPRSASRRFRAR